MRYAIVFAVVAACTGLSFALYGKIALSNLAMIFLLGSVLVSTQFGAGESIVSAVLGIGALNYFFVPPRFTLSVAESQFSLTFVVILIVSLLVNTLTRSVRSGAVEAEEREKRTAALLSLSSALASSRTKDQIAAATRRSVRAAVDCDSLIVVQEVEGLRVLSDPLPEWAQTLEVTNLVQTCLDSGTRIEEHGIIYLPLPGTNRTVGVLVGQLADKLPTSSRQMLEAMAAQAAGALDRTLLAKESHVASLQVETEKLKNSLLRSVSHDLRTPLTAITGAASRLMKGELKEQQEKELATTIFTESDRLNRLVRNLLDMTRVESGQLNLSRQWNSVEELIGSAVLRTESIFGQRPLKLDIAPDLPLLEVDAILLEQVLVNLLENAARHTANGSTVMVSAKAGKAFVRIEVADNGGGIPPGAEQKIFDKFYRAASVSELGFGLGLAISKAIVEAHKGRIWARNRVEGGAAFILELPITPVPAGPVEE